MLLSRQYKKIIIFGSIVLLIIFTIILYFLIHNKNHRNGNPTPTPPNPPQQPYCCYYPTDISACILGCASPNSNINNCSGGIVCDETNSKIVQKCPTNISPKETKRMVSYIESWQQNVNMIGTPENYTHIIYSFAVTYDNIQNCSGLCTPWLMRSVDDAKTIIDSVKLLNKDIKVLISLGGWAFSNDNTCKNVCIPNNNIEDNPSEYNNATKYNCVSSGKQPSYYCYGDDADIDKTSTNFVKTVLNILESVKADGLDLDLEDSSLFQGSYSDTCKICDFIISVTTKLQGQKLKWSEKQIILTQAPMNDYVNGVSNSSYYRRYVMMLKQISNCLDFISIQFYNNSPELLDNDNGDGVLAVYDYVVKNVFDGDASKVVIGTCTETDNLTGCKTCSTQDICSNGCNRTNVIQKVINKYSDFGGVMQWAASGDVNGSFSAPILKAMGKNPKIPKIDVKCEYYRHRYFF